MRLHEANLKKLMSDNDPFAAGFSTGMWVGGNDIAEEGQWVWTDGEPVAKRLVDAVTMTSKGHCLQANSWGLHATACNEKAAFLVAEHSGR